jgi:hypothetical protein
VAILPLAKVAQSIHYEGKSVRALTTDEIESVSGGNRFAKAAEIAVNAVQNGVKVIDWCRANPWECLGFGLTAGDIVSAFQSMGDWVQSTEVYKDFVAWQHEGELNGMDLESDLASQR